MKPTREQIESATPDELNAMVAEMMGWRKRSRPDDRTLWFLCPPEHFYAKYMAGMVPNAGFVEPFADAVMYEDGLRYTPRFSTDSVAAILVAERFRITFGYIGDGCYAIAPEAVEESQQRGTNILMLRIYGRENEKLQREPALPLAICRAALLRWIEQPEME